jgi:dCTP deaminase
MAKPDVETSNLFSEHGAGTTVLMAEDITTMAQNRRLIVDGFDQNSLQATSYDFRIGKKAVVGGQGNELDLEARPLVIEPGSYAGIISFEKVKLPNNVYAQIGSKRKFSYDGLILLTGSIIDPGYEGYLLFGLYNASTKKVVLPKGTKLCNVIFHRLPKDVKAVSPDPYLLDGNFPPDFLTKMANVEVLPWNRISEEVRRIQELAQAILDLKVQYNDVLEPIKTLTKNVDKVNTDVALLAEQIRSVGGQVNKLEQLSERNAEHVRDVSLSVKSLRDEVAEQRKDVRDVTKKADRFGLLVYIGWGIALLVLGAVISNFVSKALSSAQQNSPPPSKQTAPARP